MSLEPGMERAINALFEDFMHKVEHRCQETEARARFVFEAILGKKGEVDLAAIMAHDMHGGPYSPPYDLWPSHVEVCGHPVHPEVFSYVMRLQNALAKSREDDK